MVSYYASYGLMGISLKTIGIDELLLLLRELAYLSLGHTASLKSMSC